MSEIRHVTPEDCTTPTNFDASYDWRQEKWVGDVPDLLNFIGCHIAAAMNTESTIPNATPQQDEDAVVLALLRPDIIERFVRSSNDDCFRHRVAQAIAQAIDLITKEWHQQGRK